MTRASGPQELARWGLVALRLALRATIALLVLAAVPGITHAKWQTTTFEVFEGPPSETLGWRTMEQIRTGASTIPTALRDEIEAFAREVARYYEALGFADPVANGFSSAEAKQEKVFPLSLNAVLDGLKKDNEWLKPAFPEKLMELWTKRKLEEAEYVYNAPTPQEYELYF